MGMLSSIFGAVLGQVGQQGGNAGMIANVVGGMLANDGDHGGLGGLVGKFQQAGMGDVVSSWIGKGENMPISADQLQSAYRGNGSAGGDAEHHALARHRQRCQCHFDLRRHPLVLEQGMALATMRPGHGISFDWKGLAQLAR